MQEEKNIETITYRETFLIVKNISNILSQDFTVDILFHLSLEPMRYTQLKQIVNCSDATLSRRIKKLQEYNIIKKLPVTFGNKQSHEYTITNLGQELIKFFNNFNKKNRKG